MAGPAATPLTAFCTKLADPDTLVGMVDQMTVKNRENIDNRAVALSLTIMGAAGHFTKGLDCDAQLARYLRDTNSDVIAAEAIVWLAFLTGRIWRGTDREMFERVGFVTVTVASRLAVSMIESQTGVDFTAHATKRSKFYFQAEKENTRPFEAFASVVLSSIGSP